MYKIIACDLDETLLRKDKTVSEEDIKAIHAFEEAGGLFVCATGRPFWTTVDTLKQLGQLGREGRYVISFNGGAITENKDNRLLHFAGITFEQASMLYERGMRYDVCMHVYTKDVVYAYNINQDELNYLDRRQAVTVIENKDLEFLRGTDIVKCLYENTNYDYLKSIAGEIEDLTKDMDVSYSSNRYLEFNKKGVNKGSGLAKLAEMLGVDMKDTIAVGDNYNDLPMIRAAGLGIGVANTVKDMKPLCDVLTEATCEDNAISEVIYKYALK